MTEKKNTNSLFLGHGYVSQFFCAHCDIKSMDIAVSIHKSKHQYFATPQGVKTMRFADINESILDAYDHFIISIPPFYELKTDVVLDTFHDYFLNRKTPYTIIYLSATSVYGDHEGRKVVETSQLRAKSMNGIARIACEHKYQELQSNQCANIVILRLAAIYGDRRNVMLSIVNRKITSNKNSDRVISRTHVWDIAQIIHHIIRSKNIKNAIFNVADNNPCSSKDLNDYICDALLKIKRLPMDEKAQEFRHTSFALDNKIVDNSLLKKTLDYAFSFPSYKEGFEDIFKNLNQ